MPIIVFCEECGKKYIIDENELNDQNLKIQCTDCEEIIIVSLEKIKDLSPGK